ncbi:umecyanin-like [Cornus florida]|uniref:umecyanin-like n=1 Tax=Cornus florida TaxID=4283 RepID=UPI002898494E|nr:umecyanin-like [Cornus florida]
MDKYWMCMVVAGLIAAVMAKSAVAQTKYVVGGSLGWVVPPNGAQAFSSWASDKQFMIGDILIFNFSTNEHDVLQVSKVSFDACNSANAIGTLITQGPANITLTSSGDHYYICTVGRHCQAGQKLAINVSGAPGAAPTPSSITPTTPSPTSTTPKACAPTPTPTPMPEVPPSSSSAAFASFLLTLLAISMAFIL